MWNIVFYVDHRGKCPPREFIEELPVMEQAKIRNILRLLQEFGSNLSMPHARQIKGKLWGLRPGGVRLFYFAYIGQQFVILHGYRKQSQKAPDREIKIAMRRMQELMDEV
ncbi:MAG: type II toxin-antitoxin system RelE/ParE family toxin [Chloroflexi bacterium]|jgi:phage-related protein|nr:type II toxin-antitoxin system RelE/ParE family toxin [Chloroflexota bacterium]